MSIWFSATDFDRYLSPSRSLPQVIVVVCVVLMGSAPLGCGRHDQHGRAESPSLQEDTAGVEAIDLPEIEQVKGGTTVALLSHGESPLSALQLWSPRGSADEPEDTPGLAAMCASLFCERIPTPDGVELETWAGHDMTVCEFTSPNDLNTKLLSHIGQLLSVDGSIATENRIDRACKSLEERWQRSRADPRRILSESLLRSAFGPEHPYGRPVLSLPDCTTLDSERIDSLCGNWFSERDLTVTAIGDLTLRELTATLSYLPEGQRPPRRKTVSESASIEPEVTVTTSTVPEGYGAVAFRLPSMTSLEQARAQLLLRLIVARDSQAPGAEHQGAQISQNLRKGYLFVGRHGGLLAMTVSGQPESTIEAVTSLLSEALTLSSFPPTEPEVARARLEVLRQHQLERSSSSKLGRALGYDLVIGNGQSHSTDLRMALSRAQAADLAASAQRIFNREELSISILLPEHLEKVPSSLPLISDDGAQRIDRDRLKADLMERIETTFTENDSPTIEGQPEGALWTRTGDQQVLLVRQERYSSIVAVRASLPLTGHLEGYVPGALTSLRQSISKGAPVGFSLSVPKRSKALSIEGVFLRGHAEEGLRRVIETLRSVSHVSDPLSSIHRGGPHGADPLQEPLNAGRLALRNALYGPRPVLWEAEGLIHSGPNRGSPDHRELHSTLLGSSQLVVTVVGPVDPLSIYRAFRHTTSTLSHRTHSGDNEKVGQNFQRGESQEIRQVVESDLSHLCFAYTIDEASLAERDAIEVIATMLASRRGQIWRRFVGTGLASEVGVELDIGRSRGHLALFVTTTPENEEQIRNDLPTILAPSSSNISDYELDQARQLASGRIARSLSTVSARAEALEMAHLSGLPHSFILDSPSRILEVEAQDVHRLMTKLFQSAPPLTVIIGSEPTSEAEASDQTPSKAPESHHKFP